MNRFLLVAVLILCWTQVSAQTVYVPIEYDNIQSAINDANDGDVIVALPDTYQENINFLGKAITLRSVDPNNLNIVAATIIDGNEPADSNFGSAIVFNSGEGNNSVLSGFTITGGTGSWLPIAWQFKEVYWNRCGGGVVCYNMSEPTITKNTFLNNTAGEGGGIYIYGDPVDPNNPSNPPIRVKPVITNNTFFDNSAVEEHGFEPPNEDYPATEHGDGGAIVCFQGVDAVITDNLIEDNHADYYGGGIHLRQWSNSHIENNHVIANEAALGAGIHITYNSEPNVINNLIQANIAGGLGGGGIYVYYYSNPLIERNTITQNESANGAGIAVFSSSNPVIRNNMIADNVNGAGIRVKGESTPVITNNTIVGNTASAIYGGGVDCITDSVPIIENNIIASNGDSYGIYASTTPPVIKYNNVWGNGAGNYNTIIGDQTGTNGNISVKPNFVNPDSNDYALNYDSECINAGDPNFVPAPNEADYDGNPRLLGQYVDMGADEVLPVWNVNNSNQYETIQQAIDDANDYDTILVTIGTHTGTGNKNIDFDGKPLTLRSIDPNDFNIVAATIIDCQSSGRGFRFNSGEDTNSVINGLTIANGGSVSNGGAIYCTGSSPTINNCIIRNNIASDHGAGIYCAPDIYSAAPSNPIINNCFFNSNSFVPSGYGGAIYCTKSSPTITNCVITNNDAPGHGRHGGGICCWGDQDAHGDALVANCIISGNYAGHRGGGLYAYWSSPNFINCTIIGNTALEGGGISSFRESNPQVINCIVRDNIAPEGNQLALINTLRVWPKTELITEMTVSYSDIEGGQSQVFVDPNMILHWGEGNIDIDPNFADPGYWDDANTPAEPNDDFFVVGNYHILPISGCIDVGDNSSVPPQSVTDIDGEQRIFNDIVDMGADEMVTNPADFDSNGIVDYSDLKVLTNEWLDSGGMLQSDLFDDDFIDFADYAELADQWLRTAGWYE